MKRKECATKDDKNQTFNSQLLGTEVDDIASHIFGADSLKTILTVDSLNESVTQKSIIENTNVWIYKVLDRIEPPFRDVNHDTRPGRIGLPEVRFDSSTQVGTLIMSADRLHAQAQSNFSSVKANVCLFLGRWQYEIQLESKHVMQLGWAMANAQFTPESGVGDSLYSYSFDGNRVRKWNLVTSEYGEPWQVGDVIGCTIDLDVGSIHFYRNGRDLGEAFSKIPLGPDCAYFPAISLAFDEKVQTNFGSIPFKYPVESYQPIQQPPVGAVLRANQLLHWLYRVSSVPKTKATLDSKFDKECKKVTSEAACLIFSELLIQQLSCLLNKPYVIESCIVPYLHDITSMMDKKGLSDSSPMNRLSYFCDSLILFLEPEDIKELLNVVCKCLIQKFNQTSVSLEYTKQKQSLVIFSDLCQNTNVRKIFLKQPGFIKTRVPEFMNLQPIDVMVLKESVPQAWWPDETVKTKAQVKEYDAKKKAYFGYCKTIKSMTIDLETLQESVLMVFLNNNDGTPSEPSSRKSFLHLFRTFLKDNHLSGLVSFFLNNLAADLTPLPVAHSFFHRLLGVLRVLWERELPQEPVHVPLATFYDGAVDYFTIERVGGLLSYLLHTFRPAIVAELGESHAVLTGTSAQVPRPPPTVQVQLRGMDMNTGLVSTLTRWINMEVSPEPEVNVTRTATPGELDGAQSLAQLLDGIIMLYTVAAHKYIQQISMLRDDMDKYITALNEARARLILAKETCPGAVAEITVSIETFEKKIEEKSKVLMAWVRGAVYTPEKQANLVWLLRAVMLTLNLASDRGDLFSFVPDFYIDAVVNLCSALRNYFSPTLTFEDFTGHKELLVQVAEFLVKHLADPRVVNLGSKDTIVEALAGYISKKQTMESLEAINQESKDRLVSILLKPYDNRPWGQTNWILMRMWQGCGFAFRYQKSPHLSKKLSPRTPSSNSGLLIHQAFEPCPSYVYQKLVANYLNQNEELAAEFLNSVLKQLNWSFSEFISMMQEIQNLSKRPERVIIDARQLKICSTCFDFVISLLRVLEMLCRTCPQIFTDLTREGTENLLERLCQLLNQILLRVTTTTGCFAHVISLEVPDLDSIDQFPILAATVGVLVALLAEDIANTQENEKMSTAVRSLLSEPAFQISSLKYVLGQSEQSNEKQERFSFLNYPQAVSVAEVAIVSELISMLIRNQARMSITKDSEDEEELCPICCAMPLAVMFIPCKHRSCKSCITHHLMDCRECFFCKTAIISVVGADGKLLFDSSATSIHKNKSHQNTSNPL